MFSIKTRTFVAVTLFMMTAFSHAEIGVTNDQIILGQSAAFSGAAGELGKNVRAGAEAYFDKVNKEGGIYGRKIILRSLDDGYEGSRAAENTRLLIEREKVFALFGYVGTPTSLAAEPIFTEEGVPFIAPVTGAEALRSPFNKQIINIRASYFDETREIVKALGDSLAKNIAVFYQDDSYGQAGLKGVTNAMAAFGSHPIETGTVERNSVDVKKAVDKISAKNPGGIIMISTYKSCAEFVRQIKKRIPGVQLWNVSFVGTNELSNELGNEGRGVAITQVVPFPYLDLLPITREHRLSLKEKGTFTSLEGYIAAKVFVEGLRKAGKNPTRESLISAFENAGDIDVGGYKVSFSPSNHNGSKYVSTTMITRDGKIMQ